MLKTLGPYRLERLIGRGGMGTVYVGSHQETGEQAAIKLLSMALAEDSNFRARFNVEIETLKQLRHPNIVQILGDGEQDGQLFYVMEYIEGKSLQDMLQVGHPFEFPEVIRIAIEVCAALKHAHDCGVIHRDLKPANLLRTLDGHIKLTDFGIAKLFGATHRTADGSVVGTADFMAPEQADSRPVTNRTDLYGLGAVMFTLLARRTPFQGGSLPQVVHKLKYEEAPSVRRYASQVPEELDLIISELLRKDPRQRIATALVLANRLRALEHAMQLSQRSGLTPDAQPTRLAPSDQPDVEKTSPGSIRPGSRTEVSPTNVNETNERANEAFYWNEATVQTSALSPPSESEPAPPVVPLAAPEPRPNPNRFTTIDEHYQRKEESRASVVDSSGKNRLRSIAGIVALLVAIVGICYWAMQPPSADSIYEKIQDTIREKTTADAMTDIESFLKRFPNDPRSAEVEDLRMDVESAWLTSRLLRRKRKTDGVGIEPYEQKWLDAVQIQPKDPQRAVRIWQGILEDAEKEANVSASMKAVLDATRHQLKRIAGNKATSKGTYEPAHADPD